MSGERAGRWTCCFLVLSLPFLFSQTGRPDQAIWKGGRGNYAIEWSVSALRATRSDTNQIAFDARSDAEAAWARIVERSKGASLKAEFTYRLLSVMGSFLTIEEGEYCDCGGAHPTELKKFRAIQLDRSMFNAPVAASLTELFPSQTIFKALVADSLVHRALGSDAVPGSLNELLEQLGDQTVKVGECEYSFSRDLMGSFALYSIQDDKVLVRLGLPSAVESCRGRLTQIGITLAVSEANHASFSIEKNSHERLLMADAEQIPRSKLTSFSFSQSHR
jgi:hypothetical protein